MSWSRTLHKYGCSSCIKVSPFSFVYLCFLLELLSLSTLLLWGKCQAARLSRLTSTKASNHSYCGLLCNGCTSYFRCITSNYGKLLPCISSLIDLNCSLCSCNQDNQAYSFAQPYSHTLSSGTVQAAQIEMGEIPCNEYHCYLKIMTTVWMKYN